MKISAFITLKCLSKFEDGPLAHWIAQWTGDLEFMGTSPELTKFFNFSFATTITKYLTKYENRATRGCVIKNIPPPPKKR